MRQQDAGVRDELAQQGELGGGEVDELAGLGDLAVFYGVLLWTVYVALEPYVRKISPDALMRASSSSTPNGLVM